MSDEIDEAAGCVGCVIMIVLLLFVIGLTIGCVGVLLKFIVWAWA